MDVADDSLVTIYGILDLENDGNITGVGEGFQKLNDELSLDEDVGSGYTVNELNQGSLEVAPWISVQVSMPDGASVEIEYIVYHTSTREVLVGGRTECDYDSDSSEDCAADAADTDLADQNAPDFTNTERKEYCDVSSVVGSTI